MSKREQLEWEAFAHRAARVMRMALDSRLSPMNAAEFFEKASFLAAHHKSMLVGIVCEIDGNPITYQETLDLFESGATEEDVVKFLDE